MTIHKVFTVLSAALIIGACITRPRVGEIAHKIHYPEQVEQVTAPNEPSPLTVVVRPEEWQVFIYLDKDTLIPVNVTEKEYDKAEIGARVLVTFKKQADKYQVIAKPLQLDKTR